MPHRGYRGQVYNSIKLTGYTKKTFKISCIRNYSSNKCAGPKINIHNLISVANELANHILSKPTAAARHEDSWGSLR